MFNYYFIYNLLISLNNINILSKAFNLIIINYYIISFLYSIINIFFILTFFKINFKN